MAPVPTRRNSMRFVTTYAGHTGESELLEELYRRGLEGKPVPELADIDNGDGEPACRAIDRMFMFWSHKPRMPWQTPEYYARQRAAPGFRESAYLRLHENRWQAPESSFVTALEWDACKGFVPDLDVDRPMLVAGVDGAIRDDYFAVTIVSRHPDAAKRDDHVMVRAVKVWAPQSGKEIDFREPFEWLKDFAKRHKLYKIVYDEWGLADWARRFQRETGVYCAPFSQGADRNRADDLLFELIRSRRVVHNGDAQLAQHIQNAGWKEASSDQEGRGRLVKLAKHRKIDAAVATAMASHECLRLYL
jgi:phage terminase large subunit-like protein